MRLSKCFNFKKANPKEPSTTHQPVEWHDSSRWRNYYGKAPFDGIVTNRNVFTGREISSLSGGRFLKFFFYNFEIVPHAQYSGDHCMFFPYFQVTPLLHKQFPSWHIGPNGITGWLCWQMTAIPNSSRKNLLLLKSSIRNSKHNSTHLIPKSGYPTF